MHINEKDLDELEKKYYSPTHVIMIRADDTGPLYFIKEGKAGCDRMMAMHRDLHKLIKSLRTALGLMG